MVYNYTYKWGLSLLYLQLYVKSDIMASRKDKKIQVMVSLPIYQQFQAYCEEEGIGMSEMLRDVVKDILKTQQKSI